MQASGKDQTDSRDLIVYGSGGHGQVVAEAATLAGFHVLGFLDDHPDPNADLAYPVLSSHALEDSRVNVIVAIGDPHARRRITEKLQADRHHLATVVHPAAFVCPSAELAPGVFVGPRAVIHTHARIDAGAIVNTAAVVEHHNHIGAFAHIAPAATLGGTVRVGVNTLVGLGARVLPNLTIGRFATIAAGAVVTTHVPDHTTAVGIPARISPAQHA